MRASSFAATGIGPAAPFSMPHSRILAAFFCVALAHAALIAVFVATARTPAPRAIQSTAIIAQLLQPEPDATPVAVQSTQQQKVAHAPTELHRPQARAGHAPKPSAARPPAATATATTPTPTAAARSIVSTAAASPNQSSQPPASSPNAVAQPATASAAIASSAKAPATRETIALAAPKHVEHADCRITKPAYPELSKRRGETGTATVRFIIGTTGGIESVSLVKSSGFSRLDDAAVEALRSSTCQPYLENGSPIRVFYTQAFTFGLDDD